ncbi:prisilkin-39-like [Copidosoma floridanum]|uniref:prisilkin-39-like n=1 Tax=Copidosoma floridanum TaxID=29053 RepID=UPI0006C94266|nr:prisilkin-39-like [Copidosoma floridanum]
MFKLLVLLSLAVYASAGGLYSGLGSYGYYGSPYSSAYSYGGYAGGYGGYGHGGSVVSLAPSVGYSPYASSYASVIKYPSYYTSGLYPGAKKIIYANPLNKLGYYSPTYLGGYPASYSPYYGYGHGYGGYYDNGLGLGGYNGYLGGLSAYGHNVYNHY